MRGLSIFSLPLGTVLLTYLLSCPAPVVAQSYVLDTAYSGSNFFNGWNFWTDTDPTHGFVQYLSQTDAQTAGLISQAPGGAAYMGVDKTKTYSTTAQGRKSVRITTQKSWTHGLFIGDIAHMPDSTCGVWPAFWMFGPNWPNSGEIDMIEGVNRQTGNQVSLHTGPNCVMTAGTQSGTTNSLQCDGTQNSNLGCNVATSNSVSYGTGFNNNGGGVYATEWTSTHIQTWFFPRGSIPSDITAGTPTPSMWGSPQASYQGGSGCNIDTHFMNQNLVFDTTFCGDWAGNAWAGDSTCTVLGSCVAYVAGNPSAFTNSYWSINSVKVYQIPSSSLSTTSSSSTTLTTSTRSTTSTTSTSTSKSSTSSSTSSSASATSATTSKLSISKSTTSTSIKPPTTTIPSSTLKPLTSTTTSNIKLASSTPSWKPIGCYSDNVNNAGRSLPYGKQVPGGYTAMTVELCQAACKAAGYVIAGLEYSQECWCGNAFVHGGAYVGADGTSGCTMACRGNGREWCGGGNRLSSYKWS